MNFLKKKFTKMMKKKVDEILEAPESNPQFQQMVQKSGGFLQKYVPDQINCVELVDKALRQGLASIDWVIFIKTTTEV